MAHKPQKHKTQKDFAKDVATYLVGSGLGVIASKVANDAMNAINANPVLPSTQIPASDAVVVVAGIVGAYYAEKKRKVAAKKLLVGVATAPVAVNVYKAVGTARWFALSPSRPYGNGANYSMGKYNRGFVAQPIVFSSMYPRR